MFAMLKLLFIFMLVNICVLFKEARSNPSYNNISHRRPLTIVNGTNARNGEFPYMVQLRTEEKLFVCGGSIIGDKWILTAGHCVKGRSIKSIVYGTNILYEGENNTDPNTVANVKSTYYHPKFFYNDTKVGSIPLYDVGIIELETPICFNKNTQPIKLVDAGAPVPFHIYGLLAGWGVNFTESDQSELYLQKISLKLLNDQECAQGIFDYGGYDIFNGKQNLCSNDHWNGACFGDSGGAFVINGVEYGIVSWSLKPCGSSPATYSHISNPEFRDYIRYVTGI